MSEARRVAPFDYIIFGASGDLTMRKLLPAFYQRYRSGEVPDDAQIIGVARSSLSDEDFRGRARKAFHEHISAHERDDDEIERFLKLVHYVSVDAASEDADWAGLKKLLGDNAEDRVRVFYCATAPKLYGAICENLSSAKLISDNSRIVLEKPIGVDLASAKEINEGVGRFFEEEDIFRIDHYLGKEMVQDVIALRFANPMMEAVWSGKHIHSVQITAAETVGVEGRAAYYDNSGALRDMVQNHLLQILSLVAMEPPTSLEADALRDAKVAALKALRPLGGDDMKRHTVRAQYTAGEMREKSVAGYVDELGQDSNTETFVALCAEIDTPRWKNVPFFIRTGKRLRQKTSEIVITFRAPEAGLFDNQPAPSQLLIRVQPHEGISWVMNVKDPTVDAFDVREGTLDARFAKEFGVRYPDSYERLLLDAVRGFPALFIRRDEVEAAWRWIEPILDAWGDKTVPMSAYDAGTWGPKASDELIARYGGHWHNS